MKFSVELNCAPKQNTRFSSSLQFLMVSCGRKAIFRLLNSSGKTHIYLTRPDKGDDVIVLYCFDYTC